MIIQEIKLGKKLLSFKEEVILVTDSSKIYLKETLNAETVRKLHLTLQGLKIENVYDFSRLKELLKFDSSLYPIFESVLLQHIKSPWKMFDATTQQVPRPMNIVLKKETGITEFVVFSLNAKNFHGALSANRGVVDYALKHLKDVSKMKEEEILMLLREGIDREHELVNFELRIGIIFNNFSGGKYHYNGFDLEPKEQFDFICKLIENYGVCYVENPFSEKDLDSYKRLFENYKNSCLICMNSRIHEYSKGIHMRAFNAVVPFFTDIPSFKTEIGFFKEKNLNIVADLDSSLMDVLVGLDIPLVKLRDDVLGNISAKRLGVISDEIIEMHEK